MEWITACNPTQYDVVGAFSQTDIIDWKQSNRNIQVGDIVYIYVSKPVAAIMFKCKVNRTNFSTVENNVASSVLDGTNYSGYGNYMELEKICEYGEYQITFEELQKNGLSGRIQGPRRVNDEIRNFINSVRGNV